MNIKDSIAWFKATFADQIQAAIKGTPFTEDLLAAIAFQETGSIWSAQIGALSTDEILRICVGDTLDTPNRSAFPKNRAELLNAPRGAEMFKIAHEALVEMANYVPGYRAVARRPNKFCHGFGIFQYDIQFFKTTPNYFLDKQWYRFDVCVRRAIKELKAAMRRQGWASKNSLDPREMVYVAIAYNRGRADLSQGFKQGYKSADGVYYGENINDYLKIAKSISPATVAAHAEKAVEVSTPISVLDNLFAVTVQSHLNLRQSASTTSKILAKMQPGQLVRRLSGDESDRFWRIEAKIDGVAVQGYAACEYLKPIAAVPPVIATVPSSIDFSNVPRYIRLEIDPPQKNIKKNETGKYVRRVQEWLCHHGFKTGIDEDFGNATCEQVKRFQAANGINATGVVNSQTWKALVKPMTDALAPPENVSDLSIAEAIKAVAEQHLKQHPAEIGGPNGGPWVRLYCEGHDGKDWAWCAGFVSLIMHQACFYSGKTPPIKGSVSCDQLSAQAQAAGLFVPEADISSGKATWNELGPCAIFLRRRTPTDWTHTGYAVRFDGKESNIVFETIEGNTNDEGIREGFEACRRVRSVARSDYDFVKLG